MGVIVAIIIVCAALIMLTGKSRRKKVIERCIIETIESGTGTGVFPHVYFEAALGYTLEKESGGKRVSLKERMKHVDDEYCTVRFVYGGEDYIVMFSKAPDGSLVVRVR